MSKSENDFVKYMHARKEMEKELALHQELRKASKAGGNAHFYSVCMWDPCFSGVGGWFSLYVNCVQLEQEYLRMKKSKVEFSLI